MVCAIIGVCDTPRNTSRHLRRFLNDMIEKHNVDTFVINSFNDFSVVATWTLIDVKKKHPHIKLKLATTSHSDFWKEEFQNNEIWCNQSFRHGSCSSRMCKRDDFIFRCRRNL